MSRATYNPNSFAEGRFRFAYKGEFTEPPSQRGKKIVVKKKKASYTWASTDWNTSETLQEKSRELAEKFNQASSSSIKFAEVNVFQVISSSSTSLASPSLA